MTQSGKGSEEFKPIRARGPGAPINGAPTPNLRDSILTSIQRTGGGGGSGGGCDCDMSSYLLKDDAKNTYQTKGDYATLTNGRVPYSQLPEDNKSGGRGGDTPDLTAYLTKDDAKNTYQPIGNYLTEHQDISELQPKGDYATLTNGRLPYSQLPEDIKSGGGGGDTPDLSSYLKTEDADKKYQVKGDYLTAHQSLDNCVKYNNLKVPIESVTVDDIINYLKTNIDNRITGEQDDFYNAIVTAIKEGYRVTPEITAPNGISIELQLPNHKAETMNGSGFVIEIEDIGDKHKKKYVALFFIVSGRYTTVPYEFTDQLFNPSEPQWRYDNNGKYIVDIDEVKYKVTNPNVVNWFFINREYHESQIAKENNVDASKYIEYTLNKGNAGGYCPLNRFGKIDAANLPGDTTQITTPSTTTPALTEDMKKEIFDMIYPPKSYMFIPNSDRCTDITKYLKYGTWPVTNYTFKLTRSDGKEINVKLWQRYE